MAVWGRTRQSLSIGVKQWEMGELIVSLDQVTLDWLMGVLEEHNCSRLWPGDEARCKARVRSCTFDWSFGIELL